MKPDNFQTTSKKNKAGEITNPTSEDISRFNSQFSTSKPKKSNLLKRIVQGAATAASGVGNIAAGAIGTQAALMAHYPGFSSRGKTQERLDRTLGRWEKGKEQMGRVGGGVADAWHSVKKNIPGTVARQSSQAESLLKLRKEVRGAKGAPSRDLSGNITDYQKAREMSGYLTDEYKRKYLKNKIK